MILIHRYFLYFILGVKEGHPYKSIGVMHGSINPKKVQLLVVHTNLRILPREKNVLSMLLCRTGLRIKYNLMLDPALNYLNFGLRHKRVIVASDLKKKARLKLAKRLNKITIQDIVNARHLMSNCLYEHSFHAYFFPER